MSMSYASPPHIILPTRRSRASNLGQSVLTLESSREAEEGGETNTEAADEAGQAREELDLMYDPMLNCYYDPKTNKYYELK